MKHWQPVTQFLLATILLLGGGVSVQAQQVLEHPQGLDEIAQMRVILEGYRAAALEAQQYDATQHAQITAKIEEQITHLRAKLASRYTVPTGAADVRKYLPADAKLDGSVDYTSQIQQAVNENRVVVFTGSGDKASPAIYGVKIPADTKVAIQVPDGHVLLGSPDAVIRRLPSEGKIIRVGQGGMLMGLVIDGNKEAHWPEFQELGKNSGMAVELTRDGAVIDCLAYNVAGIAFATYSNGNVFWKSVARNIGYIDLKYNATFYQGKWDNYSGDGFYARGFGNLVMDCETYDCFRWGYTTCHDRSGTATYINSTMHNTMYRTYGFIDLEDCKHDPKGSMVINMRATQGSLTVAGTHNALIFNSEAGSFHAYTANNLFVAGSKTHGGGMGIGGWTSSLNAQVRGGDSPVYLGNTIVKSTVSSGISNISDWSFSVFSSDEKGLVAGNALKEYQGPAGKGTGLQFDKVTAKDNTVEYGQWIESNDADVAQRAAATDTIRTRALREFNTQVSGLAGSLGAKGKISRVIYPRIQADFIHDLQNVGEQQAWFKPENKPAADQLKPIFFGEHWDSQHGYYEGNAWYFTDFKTSGDDYHACDRVYLLLSGVDTESKVYINGQQVGITNAWNKPFLLEIPRTNGPIKWDDSVLNHLAIRVFSPQSMGGVYGQVALILASGNEPMSDQAPATPTPAPKAAKVKTNPVAGDLTTTAGQKQFQFQKRAYGKQGEGVHLPAEAGFVSKEKASAGTYRITVRVDESDPKYQYHVPQFIFLHPDAAKLNGITRFRSAGVSFYGLTLLTSGQVRLFKYDPATDKDQIIAEWQKPGPSSPARYSKDKPLRMVMELPEPGGQIKLYFDTLAPKAEPDAEITLPADAPSAGHFGFHNAKWYSKVLITQMQYAPAR